MSDLFDPPESDSTAFPVVALKDEMERSYLDYAMSVIVSRALPDVRDGLKPVHRRILYSMYSNGYEWNKPYRKSARVVGDVIGKYHPHGDQAIYDALARMAQVFSLRLPLLDGQGNFGSIDGDSPAAMRYTEVRMARPAHHLLTDLDKDTVDFRDNYDGGEQEPTVLPAAFPNLLVNGAGGIAVGMATNIPPHNFGEIIDACHALLDQPDLDSMALMQWVKGPDFPTGGVIVGRSGIVSAYNSGRGIVIMRGKVEIEAIGRNRQALIITEIPYQVSKAVMIERIAELVRHRRIDGITDLRDESDRHGIRVVIELRQDAIAEIVLNNLYRHSSLQSSFGCNMVALSNGRPLLMSLRDMLVAFLDFREQVLTRRIRYELGKARDRAHILIGLRVALAHLDEVVKVIRAADDPATARAALRERIWPGHDIAPFIALIADPRHTLDEDGRYRLSEMQARAILDLRLHRLTGLGREDVEGELKTLHDQIVKWIDLLHNRPGLLDIIREELTYLRGLFATPRRSEIEDSSSDFDDEALIPSEDMVVTVSKRGYVKRVPLSTYRAQKRGGKGRTGMTTRDGDFVTKLFIANTHNRVLFFTTSGIVHALKIWRLPEAAPAARGKALVNLLPLAAGETIAAVLPLIQESEDGEPVANHIVLATRGGHIRRNAMSSFERVARNGKIAMRVPEGDMIIDVALCHDHQDVFLTSRKGKAIRFKVSDVRVFSGRTSPGVRGIRLDKDDAVVTMTILDNVVIRPPEQRAYLRHVNQMRRSDKEDDAERNADDGHSLDADEKEIVLSAKRIEALQKQEQFILTICENGYGKRSSAYEHRVTRRGGKGMLTIMVSERNGMVVGAFAVDDRDQIALVTSGGRLIRCPVAGIRIIGRNTQGVTILDTDQGEAVASVGPIPYDEELVLE